jgi:bifunctional pyridoxal-dependent enzyme with beta-cystathionase and maltose regulon repressor activities
VRSGSDFGPGGDGHVRANLATSTDRLLDLVARLGAAFDPAD